MDGSAMPSAGEVPGWQPLLDVSQRSVVELLAGGDTGASPALARCVDRSLRSLDDPNGVISAFQNFASQPTPEP